ncbi:MAG: GGDEF domain-containing protein [Thiovulaceae bacterium]|nr:GGDEF domain-containing protein [Sulfurimonadaceae bacterium]
MSLKNFHNFFFLFTLIVLTLLSLYLEQLLQKDIEMHVKESILENSAEIRERVRNRFDTITHKFALYEKMSLSKLNKVAAYVAEKPDEMNLTAIAQSINANIVDGRYEVYIINAQKVIEKSSYGSDIGLDFKEHPYFSEVMDKLKTGEQTYVATALIFDAAAMDMRQYFMIRGRGDYWVEIAHLLSFDNYDDNGVASLQTIYPSLKSLDLYLLTADNVQYVNKRPRPKGNLTKFIETNKNSMAMMLNDLGLKQGPADRSAREITESFKHRGTVFLRDDTKREATVYALTSSDSGNDTDKFMLITKMKFDLNYYQNNHQKLRHLHHFFIFFILAYALLSFTLMYYAVIRKITGIARQMKKDEPITPGGFLFSEFHYLIERYNNFLMQWKEEVKHLNDISMHDELTKSYNRRYFNMKVQKHIDLFRRYGQEFSMIMFDIDDFKKINDAHGHDMGDQILRSIVNDVKKQIRSSDILCRIGGEEFAVILPETKLEEACIAAEKIRKAVAMQRYIENAKVTISLGVDTFDEKYDFNSFYRAVDSFLYKSKRSGKNCVYGDCQHAT